MNKKKLFEMIHILDESNRDYSISSGNIGDVSIIFYESGPNYTAFHFWAHNDTERRGYFTEWAAFEKAVREYIDETP